MEKRTQFNLAYLIFALLAIGPMLLGHTGMNWALRHLRAYQVNVVLLGEPIGATALAAILPGVLAYMARKDPARLAIFAAQVFGLLEDDQQLLAQKGILLFTEWLRKIAAPTSLADLNLSKKDIPALASNTRAQARLWRLSEYPPEIVEAILWECL